MFFKKAAYTKVSWTGTCAHIPDTLFIVKSHLIPRGICNVSTTPIFPLFYLVSVRKSEKVLGTLSKNLQLHFCLILQEATILNFILKNQSEFTYKTLVL